MVDQQKTEPDLGGDDVTRDILTDGYHKDDGDGSTSTTPLRRAGTWDNRLLVAGVALYVTVAYMRWEGFRAYFDWAESWAIIIKVRNIHRETPVVVVRQTRTIAA